MKRPAATIPEGKIMPITNTAARLTAAARVNAVQILLTSSGTPPSSDRSNLPWETAFQAYARAGSWVKVLRRRSSECG